MFILQGRSYSSSCWFNLGSYSTILLAVEFRDSMKRDANSHQTRIVQLSLDVAPGMNNFKVVNVKH